MDPSRSGRLRWGRYLNALLEEQGQKLLPSAGTHIVRATLQDDLSIYQEIEAGSRKSLGDLAKATMHGFGSDLIKDESDAVAEDEP